MLIDTLADIFATARDIIIIDTVSSHDMPSLLYIRVAHGPRLLF